MNNLRMREATGIVAVGLALALGVTSAAAEPIVDRNSRTCLHARNASLDDAVVMECLSFDDQGTALKRHALQVVLRRIDEMAAAVKREEATGTRLVVLLFAHGWNNDATTASSNFNGFVRFLPDFAKALTATGTKAYVLGIYLSWDGAVVPTTHDLRSLLNYPAFFNRMRAADQIGSSEAGVALVAISEALRSASFTHPDRVRSVIVGHSMGGLLIERAIGPLLLTAAYRRGNPDRDRLQAAELHCTSIKWHQSADSFDKFAAVSVQSVTEAEKLSELLAGGEGLVSACRTAKERLPGWIPSPGDCQGEGMRATLARLARLDETLKNFQPRLVNTLAGADLPAERAIVAAQYRLARQELVRRCESARAARAVQRTSCPALEHESSDDQELVERLLLELQDHMLSVGSDRTALSDALRSAQGELERLSALGGNLEATSGFQAALNARSLFGVACRRLLESELVSSPPCQLPAPDAAFIARSAAELREEWLSQRNMMSQIKDSFRSGAVAEARTSIQALTQLPALPDESVIVERRGLVGKLLQRLQSPGDLESASGTRSTADGLRKAVERSANCATAYRDRSLEEEATRLWQGAAQPPFSLVLLVNPASSAIRAKHLIEGLEELASYGQSPDAKPPTATQRPWLVSLSSPKDRLTRTLLPIGLRVGGWPNGEMRRDPDLALFVAEHANESGELEGTAPEAAAATMCTPEGRARLASSDHWAWMQRFVGQRNLLLSSAPHHPLLVSHDLCPVSDKVDPNWLIANLQGGSRDEDGCFLISGPKGRYRTCIREPRWNRGRFWVVRDAAGLIERHGMEWNGGLDVLITSMLGISGTMDPVPLDYPPCEGVTTRAGRCDPPPVVLPDDEQPAVAAAAGTASN